MNLIASLAPVADMDWDHMGGWGAAGWLAMVVFWALVIVALVWVVRELAGPRGESAPTATQILERRFAAGEISVEEFRQLSAALEDAPHRRSQS